MIMKPQIAEVNIEVNKIAQPQLTTIKKVSLGNGSTELHTHVFGYPINLQKGDSFTITFTV